VVLIKIRVKFLIGLSFLLILSSFLVFSINVKGANTLDFTFEKDVLYSENNPTYDANFNVRNQTVYNGHYPATYSFDYQPVGTSGSDIDFIASSNLDICEIISEDANHKKVLYIGDTETRSAVSETFENQVSGTYEFWVRFDSGTRFQLIAKGLDTGIVILFLNNQIRFYYGNGIGGDAYTNEVVDSNYYSHIKINFNCITNTYKGYCNEKLIVDSVNFYRDIDIDYINYFTISVNTANSYGFFDAIGYSWDETRYTGTHFDVGTQDTNPTGITWDGEYFWVVGWDNDKASQYNSIGTYTEVYFSIGTQDTFPLGITWNGEYFWVVGNANDKVYKYYANGTYTEIDFYVGSQDINPCGITWDGEYLWVVGYNTDEVYKYYVNGTYTGIHFDVGSQDSDPTDIIWNGNNFWIVGQQYDKVYEYSNEGVYTNIFFNVGTEENYPRGIAWDNYSFWIVGLTNAEVYEYQYVEFPYEINDNLIPSLEQTGLLEIDKYEFLFKSTNLLFDLGDDNPGLVWYDIEGGSGDDVNCMGNGLVNVSNNGDYNPGTGLEMALIASHIIYGEKIDVSFGFELIDLMSFDCHLDVYILSSDDSEVIRIRINYDGKLSYYDSGDVKVNLNDDMEEGVYYEFNFIICYEIDVCILSYFADGTFVDSYVFPLKFNGKQGLRKFFFEVEASTQDHEVHLDYVGIYKNGISQVKGEYGYLTYKPNLDWDFENQNLFAIDVRGYFGVYVVEGDYEPEEFMREIIDYCSYFDLKTVNLYDVGESFENCSLVFFLFNDWFSKSYVQDFNSLNVEGVNLKEGVNVYDLIYSHESIDVDESYFYVDLNNKLQFNLIANDDNLEYVRADFDVLNVATENKSIRFRSNINGNSKGYFVVDYETATDSFIQFPYNARITDVILPQTEYIESFAILITDKDLDDEDVCTGYVSEIKLIYYPDLEISILTLSLLAILIPLIVILVPSLAMHKKFGSTGVIITFLLMSLICTLTFLIPLWLFVVIVFSSIGFLYAKRQIGGL